MNVSTEPVLEIDGLEHHLCDPERGEEFVVHVGQPLTVPRGSVVALLGPSGCGKTTLLTILGLLRSPSHPDRLTTFRIAPREGPVIDLKEVWTRHDRHAIESLRRQHIGFALQSGELLPALTASENIAVPLRFNGVSGAACRARVEELLDAFRLRAPGVPHSRVNKLSGGEYQRVALARAIAHRPTLVFVDEPTAALNRELAWEALGVLRSLQTGAAADGATVMITHDEHLAASFADIIVRMAPVKGQRAGEVVAIETNQPPVHGQEAQPV